MKVLMSCVNNYSIAILKLLFTATVILLYCGSSIIVDYTNFLNIYTLVYFNAVIFVYWCNNIL